jgi:DNA anti-recombination protein RmuC
LISLKGQQINQAAGRILSMIAGIKQESTRFSESLRLVGGHMQRTNSAYDKAIQDYGRLQGNIDNAARLELAGETAAELNAANANQTES